MLLYPDILDKTNSPFMKFVAYEWKTRGKRTQTAKSNKIIIEEIYLPISRNGVSESITNNWDASENMSNTSAGNFLKTAIGKQAKNLAPGLAKFTEFQTGQILNDYSALTYNGNNFREFTMSYDLIPASAKEAENIKEIVNSFKKYSLSEYKGFKVLYPSFWAIDMIIPNGEAPVKFKDCVIVDVNVDYFQDENMSTFKDGNVNKSLSVSFREIERISRTNIV